MLTAFPHSYTRLFEQAAALSKSLKTKNLV
jgi:hypothetical protein